MQPENKKQQVAVMGDIATKVMIWIVAGLTAWTLQTVITVRENQAVLIYKTDVIEKRVDNLEHKP